MNNVVNYCVSCEQDVRFDNEGYCNKCGNHYDNVVPASCRHDIKYDVGK